MNSKGEIKISDFGISREVLSTEGKASTYVGTKMYMSPERLKKNLGSFILLGILFIEIITF